MRDVGFHSLTPRRFDSPRFPWRECGKDLQNIFATLATPTEVFTALADRPRWGLAFCINWSLMALLGMLAIPFTSRLLEGDLTATVGQEQLDLVFQLLVRMQFLQAILLPLTLPLRWLVHTGILFCFLMLFRVSRPGFLTLYAVVAYASIIYVVHGLVNVFVLYVRGAEALQNVYDLEAGVLLCRLLSGVESTSHWMVFADNFNLFKLWHAVTIACGVRAVCRASWKASLAVGCAAWTVQGVSAGIILVLFNP